MVKRKRREGDNSPLSSAEVKNEWSYTSAPPVRRNDMGRDNFTFCDIIAYNDTEEGSVDSIA